MPKGLGYGQKGVKKAVMPKIKTGRRKPRISVGKRISTKRGRRY